MSTATAIKHNRRASDRAPKLVHSIVTALQPAITAVVHKALTTPPAANSGDGPGVVKNGVCYPVPGTVTSRLWTLFDTKGAELTLAQARALASDNGLNEKSAAIAFYGWRKYRGHV